MKFLPVFLFALSLNTYARPPVIYGEDNRLDIFEAKSTLHLELADSTAAQIDRSNIRIVGNTAELRGNSTLGEEYGLCSDQKFFDQPVVSNCSGFLVAPDVVATAGHCAESFSGCSGYDWVFGYRINDASEINVNVPKENVYKCTKIIKQAYNSRLDFALIRLDRPVVGVNPVKLAKATPALGTTLVLIGHPSGLPVKISAGAQVLKVDGERMIANVDAFKGNSGSSVFNAATGELVGILVDGESDYRVRSGDRCTEVNVMEDAKGGEGISSVVQFSKFL